MKVAYYVDCPWCAVSTEIVFSEEIPDKNNQCVAVCLYCKQAFRLLPPDYCKTCYENKNCEPFPYIDLFSILSKDGQMRMNPDTGNRQVVKWPT